jgi:RND family efflux transporter MFP subunit
MLSAKGKYLGAEAQLSYAEVRSPIAGTVTERPLFEGETAAAGTPLITVMDTTALLAKIHLAQSAAQFLNVGDTASVTLQGVSEPVAAHISLISPALDPGSTTLEIWLRLDNKAGEYKVGTPVRTSVDGQAIENAWIVPAAAVLNEQGGGKYVMVLGSDSAAHKRAVKVGITEGDRAQILEGLSSSDVVITTGAYGLDDGTKVQLGTIGGDGDSDKHGGAN